jgi:hypothetical protein
VLNVLHVHDGRIVVGVDEVGVVGQPADAEYDDQGQCYKTFLHLNL